MGKVTHAVFADGERYPMLLGDDGIPDYWFTLFVTANLRTSHTASAIENTIRNLLHLRLWEELEGRDLIAEFSEEKFLTDEDIYDIRDHCLLNTRSLKAQKETSDSQNVIEMAAVYPSAIKSVDVVKKSHYANRLTHIAEYLAFTARTIMKGRSDFKSISEQIDDMKKRIKAQRSKTPKNSGSSNEPEMKAPSSKIFAKFMEVVEENSSDNPYKNISIRKRNSLMFEVMYETGLRSGEILSLHIEDIDFVSFKLSVIRRHDCPYETRSRQPVPKTLERTFSIPRKLVEHLRDYILNIRAHIAGANKHPFVFVTHKKGEFLGKPISDTSFINRILKPVTVKFPDIFEEVRRHGFRHDFNYRLSKKIDVHNKFFRENTEEAKRQGKKLISSKEELQIRKYLNGWSSDGSAEIYNKRHVKEMADMLMLEDMESQARCIR